MQFDKPSQHSPPDPPLIVVHSGHGQRIEVAAEDGAVSLTVAGTVVQLDRAGSSDLAHALMELER